MGLRSYEEVLALQLEALKKAEKGCYTVFGCEHPLVISLGLRANRAEDILFSDADLESQNIHISHTKRGGQATVHSPGQLLIYPILNLKKMREGARSYVNKLLAITQKCFLELKIPVLIPSLPSALSSDPTGIYTESGKITFVGIRIQKGVSYHGIAINIRNDLSLFKGIKSCGNLNASIDSVSAYSQINTQDFFNLWLHHFQSFEPLV